jgi:hypothetical protein
MALIPPLNQPTAIIDLAFLHILEIDLLLIHKQVKVMMV